MNQHFIFLKTFASVLATIGLYSVLYRENKFYRFFEHLFLGLAAGYSMVALWSESLKEAWYDRIVGSSGTGGDPGYYLWVILLPIGLMGYFVFSKRNNWISRVPIGMILGFWSGQQVQVWFNRFGPQIESSIKPVFPTTSWPLTVPSGLTGNAATQAANNVYLSQAINNIIFLVTLLAVMSYFLFSFELKSKFARGFPTLGRYLLMIGFGAIFGSTVMMRFSLLIDRMYFVWIEFFFNKVLHGLF